MPKEKIEGLISSLHEHFGDDLTSPQQQQLMDSMKHHLHAWGESEQPQPTFKESLEMLLEEVEDEHPKAATLIKEVLKILNDIGV